MLPTKKKPAPQRRVFVLDTNVLMHDPAAVFRFEEHDIVIPMIVLEELDAGKKGVSEAARNVRQVSRFLDELMTDVTKAQIDRGIELPAAKYVNGGKKPPSGRLFFQTKQLTAGLPDNLPGHGADRHDRIVHGDGQHAGESRQVRRQHSPRASGDAARHREGGFVSRVGHVGLHYRHRAAGRRRAGDLARVVRFLRSC